jgi:hypothetical protein
MEVQRGQAQRRGDEHHQNQDGFHSSSSGHSVSRENYHLAIGGVWGHGTSF